jgi:hypothetical protein
MMPRNRLFLLIIVSFFLRIIVAYSTELTNDEVYYYTYALHLQWNYFDHPPAVAVLIKLSTLNLLFTNELFIRLGAIVCAVTGTWLSYKTGKLIANERTGFYAAVLYNTSIYSSVIAGTFILPDSPQIVCWLAALYVAIKIIAANDDNKKISLQNWLLFGLLSGVCVLCKVHGIFLWMGMGLYILFYRRKMFSDIGLYLSFILTLVLISPIILWNMHNNFITYTYHSDRVVVHSFSIHGDDFLQAFLGQIFYYNPINIFLIVRSIFYLRKQVLFNTSIQRLLLLCGLPAIIIVSVISLFDPVLPHWSGPGFVTLTFFAAAYLDRTIAADNFKTPAILKASVWLIVTVVFAGVGFVLYYPGTIGSKSIKEYGNGDFTLDMSGWKNVEKDYSNWLQQQSDSNQLKHLKFVCNKWFPAAHIEYYLTEPMHTSVIGVGALNDLHNFAWLNKTRSDLKKGENALCIVPSNYNEDIAVVYANNFSAIQPLHVFTEQRSGKTTRLFTLFLLKNYNANDEVHNIPIR